MLNMAANVNHPVELTPRSVGKGTLGPRTLLAILVLALALVSVSAVPTGQAVPDSISTVADVLVPEVVQHAVADALGVEPAAAFGWGTAWKVAKCVSALTLAVATLAGGGWVALKAARALRAWAASAGGYRAAASLLVRSSSGSAKAKLVAGMGVALASQILGFDSVYNNCIRA